MHDNFFCKSVANYDTLATMTSHELLARTLRKHRQSLTTPRRIVFAALQGQEPLTMHELVERCPGVDRATVYRTVSLFERCGIVGRLQTGWKYKLELSGDFHEHHHHATCLRCGRSFILPEDATVEQRLHELAETAGFQLTRHQLELQGYCSACQTFLKE